MPVEPMGAMKLNDEVYVTEHDLTKVTSRDIAALKAIAAANPRKRARLCAHRAVTDPLHEMLIVHVGRPYIAPHKHPNKSESYHMIEGRLLIAVFDDDGRTVATVGMGEPGSGDAFFYRLSSSRYHTVVPLTDAVVYHEVTNGPFDPQDTIVAPWAASDDDREAQGRFVGGLLASFGHQAELEGRDHG